MGDISGSNTVSMSHQEDDYYFCLEVANRDLKGLFNVEECVQVLIHQH
jgi:hypothetical protein